MSAVGAGVEHLAIGDHAAVFPYHHCGRCAPCKGGQQTSCDRMAFEGIQGQTGGMAEVKKVNADQCFVLPPNVDLELGALVEPMAVAWHGVGLSRASEGDSALVVGGGPIGVGVYFALKAKGVDTIIVSEPSKERRAVLKGIGVQQVIDPLAPDLPAQVRVLTAGLGVDVAIDTAGSPQAFTTAMQSLAVGGRMILIAVYQEPMELSRSLLFGGRSIHSSSVYTRDDFQAVIDAMSTGLYNVNRSWTNIIDFDHVDRALHDLRIGRGMKVLVQTPDATN